MRINLKTMKMTTAKRSKPKPKMSYINLWRRARRLGIDIEVDHSNRPPSYWIVDNEGNGVWPDDNYCATKDELQEKLDRYQQELLSGREHELSRELGKLFSH